MRVALLAGGTGGAKLAAGVQEEVGADLAVIANTADDIEVLGVHVSPDPDLVTYWLSGEIDAERGWGIRDDTFTVFERLSRLGAPDWFSLSDRDLAACLYRRQFIEEGGRQTDVQGVELEGIAAAEPTAEVLAALQEADAIVIGPSNPVISIGPILAVPGMREAMTNSGTPAVAVSPFVAGHAVKGP